VGIGANLVDVAATPHQRKAAHPLDNTLAPTQPDIVNAVCRVEPHSLFAQSEEIESALGKVRSSDPRLLLPHPALLKRRCILEPLAELTDGAIPC
jgi:7,8-dihydro-6-hydroxymethylpterin-pyrophosphokinase